MSLLQEEREIILSNEYVDAFDFAEVTEFVANASKELFISHHFAQTEQNAGATARRVSNLQAAICPVRVFVEANVDVLPLTIDSNTRLNDYATAKKMLRLSEENEMDMLNGYPLVTHGYRTTRKMITHFDKPVSLRHGTARCSPVDRNCHRLRNFRDRRRTDYLSAALLEKFPARQGHVVLEIC